MEKLKWVCDYSCDGTNLSFEKDRVYGFSWPQRNYRCSFCKKEFKSAQALGGHMNVHRRDRARLRLSPSWDSANPNPTPKPNPNPNPSSPPSAAKFLPYNMACHSSFAAAINSPYSASLQQERAPAIDHSGRNAVALCRGDTGKKNHEGTMLDFTGFARRKDARVWKANELIRLDLNLGLLQDAKEDLDLELRLGYS